MRSFYLIKPYFYQRKTLILAGVLCLMGVDTLQLFIPRVIKWAVDDLTLFQADTQALLVYAGYILGIALMMAVLRFIWRRFLLGTSRVVEEGLRNRLFAHIQTLSASYFDRAKTGDLMALASNDLNNIRMAVGMGLVALTDAIYLGSAAIGFMAYINVKLTLFTLIPMPLVVWYTQSFGRKIHRRYLRVQETFSDLTELARESFAGIRVVKAYNRRGDEARRMDAVSRAYIEKNMGLVRIIGFFFPMMLFFNNLSMVAVLFLGGRQTITAVITPGDLVAFISYLNLLTWPMMALGWVTNLVQRGTASLDRINAILRVGPEIADPPMPAPHTRRFGEIAFENVGFSFEKGQAPALSQIRFRIRPGEMLGIAGPQGSGKTTLLRLIPRIYDVTSGSICIDGVDIRQIPLKELRSAIGFVSQEPFLFSGSIRENITLEKDIDESMLVSAAKAAALYDTILSFPDGFDTLVGEKGVVLSGGQKQRVILARALIYDPPILLLDDPIGQTDTKTAAAIIETIRSISREKTVIIASHRLSALRYADRILVMDNGRITDIGTHEALLDRGGYYAKTYSLQRFEQIRG